MKNRCVHIGLLAAVVAPLMLAWGPTGHRVVAEIAQRHLTPAARERISLLLHGYSLAEVANWHGEQRGPSRAWVEDALSVLPIAQRPAGRLALLTALASTRSTARSSACSGPAGLAMRH